MENITDAKVKDAKEAVEIVKDFFRKVKGAEIKMGTRELIDWLNFGVISVQELSGGELTLPKGYKIICDFTENLFGDKKETYDVTVGLNGEVISVKRIIENEQI
ncbi:MAG: hypothetical protein BWK75_05945 [Candidatus Altiarchaeales archaeon A3]|nr:MAG: hypothetical protein BWK75_05945 [Candidatus Altiarchaeales archaeon A3]